MIVHCQCIRVQETNGSGLTTTIQMTMNVKHLYTMAQEEIITVSQTNPCVITLVMDIKENKMTGKTRKLLTTRTG